MFEAKADADATGFGENTEKVTKNCRNGWMHLLTEVYEQIPKKEKAENLLVRPMP